MSSIDKITGKISRGSVRAAGKLINKLPNTTVSSQRVLKCVKWAGEHISSPQNRLILGVSALLSQPFIDLHNKRVDEETRKASASRTVAKILAGTTSGFLIRYYSIKAMDSMAKMPAKNRKAWETFLTPLPEFVKLTVKSLGQYKKTIGTIIALWVMVATNFLFDAPVTKMLTNKFIALNKNFAREKNEKKSDISPMITSQQKSETNFIQHNSPTNLIDIAVCNSKRNHIAGKEVHNA